MTIPSDAHLLAFGRITHYYAVVESGIKITVSGILEADLADVLVLSEPYSALQLRNVAKSLGKMRLKPELSDKFCWIVGEWAKFAPIRNAIAHHRWSAGSQPDSIKPRSIDIRSGKVSWHGDDPEEASYTADDLHKMADGLIKVDQELRSFLAKSGLETIIAAKIERTS